MARVALFSHVPQRPACDDALQHSAASRDRDWNAGRTLMRGAAVRGPRFARQGRGGFPSRP
jgi:hypothetical protein